MAKPTDKALFQEWEKFRDNSLKSAPIDLSETAVDKAKRIAHLQANPESWFKYYFSDFYTSDPAPFHKKASKRVISNLEWFEVRAWSRDLAKSSRTMMEVMYLALTGKKKNIILCSNSLDNAERLLRPYRLSLELNPRIINDYGNQENIGSWQAYEFTTKKGCSFRALGAGQSPRGTRNNEARIDCILLDDMDTDEECRNKERIKLKIQWIEQALIPTRSSRSHLTIIVCGNIIAKYCVVTELAKRADHFEVINIRDKEGKSTWAANSEASIDRLLKTISYNSAQKEYFNNPVTEGSVFKEIIYSKCPPIAFCDEVMVYADPSTSNKDKGNASMKCVVVLGIRADIIYCYKVWLDQMSNNSFVNTLYEALDYLTQKQVPNYRFYVENNSLQDPFYEQVLLPLVYDMGKGRNILPITPDKRAKPDKFARIEGTLEPLIRLGRLIFNIAEKDNPHMMRLNEQFLGVEPKAKTMDGPDAAEGGVYLLLQRIQNHSSSYFIGYNSNRKF